MANCARCGSTSFKYEEFKPDGCNFKHGFIVCANCGSVAGLVSRHDIPTMIENIGNAVSSFEERLSRIERLLLKLGQVDK